MFWTVEVLYLERDLISVSLKLHFGTRRFRYHESIFQDIYDFYSAGRALESGSIQLLMDGRFDATTDEVNGPLFVCRVASSSRRFCKSSKDKGCVRLAILTRAPCLHHQKKTSLGRGSIP